MGPVLRAYLKRDVPDLTEAEHLLWPDGEQTLEWKLFWKDLKVRQDKWARKNGIAYSAIVGEHPKSIAPQVLTMLLYQ